MRGTAAHDPWLCGALSLFAAHLAITNLAPGPLPAWANFLLGLMAGVCLLLLWRSILGCTCRGRRILARIHRFKGQLRGEEG